ncbi:hypothetical protein [Streptomyces syringium]|uniref:hypothetical protein n=1 Tax=Streptomyces syringium TaxID=76729 RepID=UPI003454CF2F
MDAYGTAQLDGDRDTQCDATATWTAPGGIRAYVLLDGIGDNLAARAWTRTAARRLARATAEHADAEAGLRAEYDRYAAEPARTAYHDLPAAAAAAAAVAVVHAVGCLERRRPRLPPPGRTATPAHRGPQRTPGL